MNEIIVWIKNESVSAIPFILISETWHSLEKLTVGKTIDNIN